MAASQKNATSGSGLSATLDRTNAADGDLLSSKDYSVWTKRDDLSLDPGFARAPATKRSCSSSSVPDITENGKSWSSW
jgi:hypothetical protein